MICATCAVAHAVVGPACASIAWCAFVKLAVVMFPLAQRKYTNSRSQAAAPPLRNAAEQKPLRIGVVGAGAGRGGPDQLLATMRDQLPALGATVSALCDADESALTAAAAGDFLPEVVSALRRSSASSRLESLAMSAQGCRREVKGLLPFEKSWSPELKSGLRTN